MTQHTWRLDNLARLAGLSVTVEGSPCVIDSSHGPATLFHGIQDALFLDIHPLQGAASFTLEALFRPDPGGPAEQRFVHLQQTGVVDRMLLETRVTPDGRWYADTFICSRGIEYPLNDPALLHPLGQWHTLAMVCDGSTMTQYVNAVRELSCPVAFTPQGPGRMSIGMRINKVCPFQGAVAVLRFTDVALPAGQLLKP